MATHGLPAWPLCGVEADALPEPEHLLLDAVRRWGAGGPAGPMGEAALLLAAAGVEGVALPLHAALTALSKAGDWRAARPLVPHVTAGERAFLLASAEVQRGRRHVALALLQPLAPPLSAYRALPPLSMAVAGLARGGWRLATGV